jgi:hypothetical protein
MEFGLFTEFHSPPGVSEAAAFDESLGQMKAAEDMATMPSGSPKSISRKIDRYLRPLS